MNEELVKILKMIENKTITAQEGERLIKEMENAKERVIIANQTNIGRFLHIDVESFEKGDEEVIEVNIPLNIAKSVLKMGIVQTQISQKVGENIEIDLEEIMRLIDLDFVGDLVIVDTKDAKVRIWID